MKNEVDREVRHYRRNQAALPEQLSAHYANQRIARHRCTEADCHCRF
jgi:hypothetical protein